MHTKSGVAAAVLGMGIWCGSVLPASADPIVFDGTTTLQLPGVAVGWPLTRGAAVFTPTVEHGHGHINPSPVGSGYVFQWTNLTTGASGTITDSSPDRSAVATGPGQIVVTATLNLPFTRDVYSTPSVGTFYVTP